MIGWDMLEGILMDTRQNSDFMICDFLSQWVQTCVDFERCSCDAT